ncbi:MAG TPA: DUF2911 domain-containing protein [Blastocatellia bacterium]|jgi:hypothetical protein|nr:DUF2911 domain-containing protein [Blastocatellia bacterium]
MKRVCLVVLIGLIASIACQAHEPGEAESTLNIGKGKVTVHYGTPKLAGRNLDEMIKPGVAWFMGMNNTTTFETTIALDFDGKRLEPGKYAIFARPDEQKNWTLLVSSAATKRPLDPATVVLSAPLKFAKDGAAQDLLKITLNKSGDGASLDVAWGTYRLNGSFKPAA